MNIGGSRFVSPTKIDWAKQTLSQRTQHLTCVALGLFALIAFPLAYLFGGFQHRRNPLTFDKSTDQICKGGRVLAKLSSVTSVAVVNVKIAKPLMQSRTQIFIRFNAEPWSFQFVSYNRDKTAERVALLLADFLSVPIVQDPIKMQRPSRATTRLR
jgi:hypothetical protein